MPKVIQKREEIEPTSQEELKRSSDSMYSESNIKSKEQYKIMTGSASGDLKTKIIETRIYKNGAKKSQMVGLLKGERILIDKGIDKKKFGIK